MNKRISKSIGKAIIRYLNLKMLRRRVKGATKGTLGSYLNRGGINRLLKIYKK